MKYYYVYILRCCDGSFYTGLTNDLHRRFAEHQRGNHPGCYTYTRHPLELAYAERHERVLDAIAREKQIKRWTRAKKMALIARDIALLEQLAECLNETSHRYFENEGG